MQLSSSAFADNRLMPEKYTCRGDNISPDLLIKDPPAESKSLVLMMHDPDAPSGDWLHWSVWNIDPRAAEISEDTVPARAVEGKTDFGTTGYGGPCPPSGTHHYVFELYALDTELTLPAGAPLSELKAAMEDHILLTAKVTGLFAAD